VKKEDAKRQKSLIDSIFNKAMQRQRQMQSRFGGVGGGKAQRLPAPGTRGGAAGAGAQTVNITFERGAFNMQGTGSAADSERMASEISEGIANQFG
ncbi:MAG: hypothetical protein SXQ77_11455, partial [Halobacteria archaeon]|nr:hypothetical protein [Halobacteria archaeon]